MANPRFQSNGVDHMIDGLQAAGDVVGDIRERLWQAAWARGHQDVVTPVPVPDVKIEGFCILAQQFSPQRTMVCVDDGEQIVGLVDQLEVPPLGAKVRMQPLYGTSAHWGVKTLATLGCGLQIRFDGNPPESTVWIDRLKTCLSQIREGEVALRRRIEIERANIEFVLPPKPFRVEMEEADKEIRDRVTGGGYTDEESRALTRAGNNKDAIAKVIAARDKRLVDAYRMEVAEFRARIPELRAEYDKRMEKYSDFRNKIDRCNADDAASRAVTDATLRATQQLETIESAVLNVRTADLGGVEDNPRAHLTEIIQTIDLLFELLPKKLQKPAASGAR